MSPEPSADDADRGDEQTQAFFTEATEVVELVRSLSDEAASHEVAAECVARVLDRYQEQPTVLDPQLEAMVIPLLEAVRRVAHGRSRPDALPSACRIMYALCKVRGYKTIVKFVPHEVHDLEPLVALLAKLKPADPETWQTAYALMVWLSMVVMVPFDLSIIDSSTADAAAGAAVGVADADAPADATLVGSIERLARAHLPATGPARDAAAVLLARLLTRPGLGLRLCAYVRWGAAQLASAREGSDTSASTPFLLVGVYTSLAAIFKLGHRTELLPQLPLLAPVTNAPHALLGSPSVTERKLGIKLLQRTALVYMPPRVARWRYQRGARSLERNLGLGESGGAAGADEAVGGAACAEEEGDEGLVPEEIEEILEQMLSALGDADTVVRWSAAKGVGRITGRLPLEMADDVVGSVLETLGPAEPANSWHGGCLALAELARRGLLLPARLPEVLPRLTTALHYDVPRGASSVGTHVRDAACYVCWAFARAFEPEVMAAHVATIAPALLVQVSFDREVNCRRAASAAFQENVGRQGNFPHGIDIVTRADYFSVGSRVGAYVNIATYLGGFDEYRRPLLQHLLSVKSKHWEESTRALAARAAASLAPLDGEWAAAEMLPALFPRSLSVDLKERHGAVLMIAETVRGLCDALHGGSASGLPAELRKQIGGVVPAIEKARLYRGRGGEVMRSAACRLLEVCALVRMPCGPKAAARTLASIDDSLKHPTESISLAAVAALRAVSHAYFAAPPAEAADDDTAALLVPRYAAPLLADPNPGLRRGYALAIGALPRGQLRRALPVAVDALVAASRMEENVELRDAETRRNAVRSLVDLACSAGLAARPDAEEEASAPGGLSTALYLRVADALIASLGDYQTDNRGDVGSWVREAAITTAPRLIRLALPTPGAEGCGAEGAAMREALPPLCARLVGALCQQINEKIDRMRELAAHTLRALLAEAELPPVPMRDELLAMLDGASAGAAASSIDFLAPQTCFPATVRLLSMAPYRRDALRGLCVSAGGMTESTLRASSAAMLAHVRAMDGEQLRALTDDLLTLLADHAAEPRLALPLMRTATQLLEARLLEPLLTADAECSLAARFRVCAKAASASSKDVATLTVALGLQILLLPYARGAVLAEILRAVALLLGHRYPKVRKAAADQLYVHLLTYGDPELPEAEDAAGGEGAAPPGAERAEAIIEMLIGTPWLASLDENAKPVRARILAMLGLPPPQVGAPAQTRQKEAAEETYAELVGEMGY